MKIKTAEFYLVIVSIIAAAGWLFSKNALQYIPPYTFIALRFSIAAVVLMMFCLPQLRGLTIGQCVRSMSTGIVLGVTLSLWVVGLQQTKSIGESAFIVSLTVVVVPVIGRLLFSESVSLSLFFALFPALIGLALLTVDNGFVIEAEQWVFLLVTIGFALHLNLSRYLVREVPSLANTSIQLVMVALVSAVAAALWEQWTFQFSKFGWGWLLVSAVVATSFRFSLQNHALQKMIPSHASIILLMEPVWTAVLGVVFLNEFLSVNRLLGCFLIFFALIVYKWKAINVWIKTVL
ncbi:MAG: DMT family transporter [Agarilytica sp.]